MPPRYSDDQLLDHLRELAARLDRSPTMADMDERGAYAADTYRRRFGSWNDALRRVGLEVNRTRDIPVEALLDEIRRLEAVLDRPPLTSDVSDRGTYGLSTYGNRFDSWSAVLEAAGFSVRGTASTVDFLREHGPSTVDVLPGGRVTTRDRIDGANTFSLADARTTTAVAYLVDDHDEEAVLRAFFDTNPGLVAEATLHHLVRELGDHGRRWQSAGKTVLREYL